MCCPNNSFEKYDYFNLFSIKNGLKERYSQNYWQIVPLEHFCSSLETDPEVDEEIKMIKKKIVEMLKKQGLGAVFFEVAIGLKTSMRHCMIEAVGIPMNLLGDAEIYFKKAFLELESEWNTHKKIIPISNEKGGIRKEIPKSFSF